MASISPCLIGIGGNSGAGKSTLALALLATLPPGTPIISGDDMHKWERGDPHWDTMTHLNPEANDLALDAAHLKALKLGQTIRRAHYEHTSGRFTEPLAIAPAPVMVYEGLHPFHLPETRNLFDVRVFLHPEETLEHHRKIIRDREKRGYSPERVMEQIIRREPDRRSYIDPQAAHADILVETLCMEPIHHLGDPSENPRTRMRLTVRAGANPNVTLTTGTNFDLVCQTIHQLLANQPRQAAIHASAS